MKTTYTCDQCGECCRSLIIEVTERDVEREPALLPVVTPFRPEFRDPLYGMLACGKPCPMLAGNACSIYATRPDVCKEFEPGDEQCQEARARVGLSLLVVA